MSSCSETFTYYLIHQEIIKQNMKKLSDECPDKVIKFLLKSESKNTIDKLIECSWTDYLDKKFVKKTLLKTCDDFEKI